MTFYTFCDIGQDFISSTIYDIFSSWDFSFFDVSFGNLLEKSERLVLRRGDESDSSSSFASTTCSTYPMHITLWIRRQTIVDYMTNIVHIYPTSRYISCNQYRDRLFFESSENFFSLFLLDITVKSLRHISSLDKVTCYSIHI